jgi:integrase
VQAGTREGRRRRIVRRGFATIAAAEEAGLALAAELAADEFVAPSAMAMSRWLDDWLTMQEQRVKPSTLASYRSIVETHLKPGLGNMKIQELHRSHLELYYDRLVASGTKSGTVKNIHSVLRKALADAVGRKLLSSNPAIDAFHIRVTRQEMEIWTAEEMRTFLSATRQHRLGPVMRFAVMTGMRRGEILGLGWRASDLEAKGVQVQRSLAKSDGGPVLVEPKSRRARRSVDIEMRRCGNSGSGDPHS